MAGRKEACGILKGAWHAEGVGGSPYRPDKPLDQIIEPDRRRERTIALIIASMVAGVCIWHLAGYAVDALSSRGRGSMPAPTATVPTYVAGRVTPSTLRGPKGSERVPLGSLHIVHVWLQGCQDCMPAFEAMKELRDRGGLDVHVPVLNVAYGEADWAWADRYGVSDNLLFDVGGWSFVKPLGINSFTTLVVDGTGNVVHRDRPDQPGYRDRVRAAVGEKPQAPPDPWLDPLINPLADPLEPPLGATSAASLSADAVKAVIANHRLAVKRTCWDRSEAARTTGRAHVRVMVTVSPQGTVSSISSSGDPPAFAKCVENEVQRWAFPAPKTATTVVIPFVFQKE